LPIPASLANDFSIMKTENSESLLSQWFRRVWNEADASAIEELAAPDMASHGLVETIVGPGRWRKEFYEPMRASFDSVKVEMLDEVVAGDKIFARLVATQVPKATGLPTTMHGMCLVRIADGKIAEAWDTWDFLGLMESMKLLPQASFGRAITGALDRHPMA
jgi:ketosteroid isomerase-like protein